MTSQILNTPRLLLKKYTPEDMNYVFENNDEAEVRKILGLTSNVEYLKEKEKYRKGYATNTPEFINFKMVDKASNIVLGGCGFHNWYKEHKRAEIGYSITLEEFKQKGLMTEAINAILDYGFNTMHLNRVEACVSPDNAASLNLLKKFNFKLEGYLHQHYFRDGVLHDSIFLALLKQEYQAQ